MTSDDSLLRVWDLPTRLFHWALVLLVALQFASGEFGWLPMAWHYWLGYATLAALLFRLAWGFVGSDTSRFAGFVRGPRAALRYGADFLRGAAQRVPGPNPLGGWAGLALRACLFVQAVSGLFASDDIVEQGPLVARASEATISFMTSVHALNRYLLVLLIALHVIAVLVHRLFGHDLVAAMLNGRARFDGTPAPRLASSWRALVVLAISAAVVWAVVAWGEAG
jgi:cytochrome b